MDMGSPDVSLPIHLHPHTHTVQRTYYAASMGWVHDVSLSDIFSFHFPGPFSLSPLTVSACSVRRQSDTTTTLHRPSPAHHSATTLGDKKRR